MYYFTTSQSAPLSSSGSGDRLMFSGGHSGSVPPGGSLPQGFAVSGPVPGTAGVAPTTTYFQTQQMQPNQPPVYFSFPSAPPPPQSFVQVNPFGGAPIQLNMCEGAPHANPWHQLSMAPPPPPGFYATSSNGAPLPPSHYQTPGAEPFLPFSSRTNKLPTAGLPAVQPTATVDDPSPCEHNNWDNLRAKNSVVTLCCRDCQRKWKQQFPIRNLCPEFHMRLVCAFGSDCPFLHVHRFKSITKSPNPAGHVVGAVRDKTFAALAIEVLAENPGKEPRDVIDEVRKRRQAQASLAAEAKSLHSSQQSNPSPKPTGTETVPSLQSNIAHGVRLPSMLPASFFPFESQRDHWNDESSMSRDSGLESRSFTQGRLGDSSNIIGSQLHGSRSSDALPSSQGRPVVQPAGMMSPFPAASGGQAQALHPVQLPNGQVVYLVAPAHLEIAPVTQLSLS